MVLLYTISEIYILTMMTFSIICLPSGLSNNQPTNRRQKKGIVGREPILINLPISYQNSTIKDTDKISGTTSNCICQTKKKWQVSRVSKKQYEIVNIIWRRTKIFHDIDSSTTSATTTTTNNWNNDIRTYLTQHSTIKNAETIRSKPTESFIEFYYLDEKVNIKNEKENRSSLLVGKYIRNRPQISVQNSIKIKPSGSDSRFLAFNLNVSPHTKSSMTTVTKKLISSSLSTVATAPKKLISSTRDQIERQKFPFLNNYLNLNPLRDKISDGTTHVSKKKRRSKNNVVLEDNKDQTCPFTTTSTTTESRGIKTERDSNDVEDTTFYDRIKFFELYDRQTEKMYQQKNEINHYNKTVKKVLPIDVIDDHKGIRRNKTKKHVKESQYPQALNSSNLSTENSPRPRYDYFSKNEQNISYYTTQDSTEHKTRLELSKAVSWSNYPFAAVYVYEPSQILCDAAAISQHWLITAGACLSRQNRIDPSMEGRSAFVSYCGNHWKRPERITYVKHTLIHPKFNKQERKRMFLYNIGLIQVVGSLMLSCPGWAPASFVSHQLTTLPEGSMAEAVGWGLDRYATKYPYSEIPLNPFMVYTALVHSNHCPGNTRYNEAKLVEPLHVMKNIYCLSLPPYNNEETDPVHGSLLVIGGKLIALYLQEERREFGKQSALYTSIWKLTPWIFEVAREPEHLNSFTIDI